MADAIGTPSEAVVKKYYAYILKSSKDGKYYYGSTSDVDKRIKKHNAGSVPSTKYRRPLSLLYVEEFPSLGDAIRRERFFKSIDGYNWLKSNNII